MTSEDDGGLGLLSDEVCADLVEHFGFLRRMLLDKVPRGENLVSMKSSRGRELNLEVDDYRRGPQTPKAIFKSGQYLTIVYENTSPSARSSQGESFYTPPDEILDETKLSKYSSGPCEISFLLPGAGDESVALIESAPTAPDRPVEGADQEAPSHILQTGCSTPKRFQAEPVFSTPNFSPIKRRLFEDFSAESSFSDPFKSPIRVTRKRETRFSSSSSSSHENGLPKINSTIERTFRELIPRGVTGTSSTTSSKCSKRSRINYGRDEIKALKTGLKQYGRDFRKIWLANKSVFHPKRTPVSLYDKWRHDKTLR